LSATASDLEALLAQRGALLEGHFRLSSGRHSDRFVQKFRLLEDPALVEPVAEAIAARFRAQRPTLVAGAAVGGIVLAYEVAKQLGTRFVFVEKEGGTPALRRGFTVNRNDRVLIVEDVATTGLSVREVRDVVRASGAEIIGAGVVIARGAIDLDVPVEALLDMPLKSYDAGECPQCRDAVPITDPGSRRA
jgi:orotate phosphoribosyltransferase